MSNSNQNSTPWTPTLDAAGQVQPYNVYEAEIFRFALAQAGGCVSRAAELLQVGRATMYRKMRAYSIIAPPVAERQIDRSRREKSAAEPAFEATMLETPVQAPVAAESIAA